MSMLAAWYSIPDWTQQESGNTYFLGRKVGWHSCLKVWTIKITSNIRVSNRPGYVDSNKVGFYTSVLVHFPVSSSRNQLGLAGSVLRRIQWSSERNCSNPNNTTLLVMIRNMHDILSWFIICLKGKITWFSPEVCLIREIILRKLRERNFHDCL